MFLKPLTRIARVQDDLVLLDLRADAYSAIRGFGARVRVEPGGRRLDADPEALTILRDAGFVTAQAGRDPAPAEVQGWVRPVRDVLDVRPCLRPAEVAVELSHLALAHLLFAERSVRALTWGSSARPEPAIGGPAAMDTAVRRAALFREVLAFQPWPRACLFRSYALRRRLRAHGVQASWVFGVRTWPFQAHCWLQIGDCVLDDAADRLASFVPILIA